MSKLKPIDQALWSQTLAQQMRTRGISLRALADAAKIGKSTLERLCDPNDSTLPRHETLQLLLGAALRPIPIDDEGLTARLWDDEAQVVDWMNLLGWFGCETLRALKCQPTQNEEQAQEIASSVAQARGWWLPRRGLPDPSPAYFPRAIESELQCAAVELAGFQQLRYRAIVVQSEWSAEARDLVAHLLQSEVWRDHFRDGLYWLEAQRLTAAKARRALMGMIAAQPSKSLDSLHATMPLPNAWWAWATTAGRNALIVLSQPTAEVAQALLTGVGPQIQGIISTADAGEIVPILRQEVGSDRVQVFQVGGYTAPELQQLVKARGLGLDETTQAELAKLRECLAGDPLRLRAIVAQWPTGQPFDRAAVYAHLMDRQLIQPAPEWLRCEEGTIERPSLMEAIRGTLCAAKGQAVVLQGVSGSGKTTLLRLIANDPALRLCFPGTVYYLERKEDGQANLNEQEVRALLLPSDESSDHLRLDELVRRLKTHWRGKSVLLLLDHWHNAEAVRVLQRVLPPQGGLIVTTRTGELAAALGVPAERVIKVGAFTPTEAEAYLAKCYELRRHPLTDQVREQFRSWYELNHNLSPLAVAFQINEALGREEATAFTVVALPSREEPGDETPPRALPRPLSQLVEESAVGHQWLIELAYKQLSPAAQACFQRLGALPELQALDRFAFTALWSSEHELRADEILRELDTQAGLLQRRTDKAGPPFWTMHAAVWAYARRLHEMAEPPERQAAAQWLERAVRTPSQQERYRREFRQRIARLGWRTWWSYFFKHRVPARVSFWKRQAYRPIKPGYVAEWQVFQEHARYFTSAELMLAYQLYCEERRSNYWVRVMGGLIVATFVLGHLSAPDRFVGMVFALMLLSCVIVLTRIFTLDMPRIPAWRDLWLTARRRMQSPPPEPEPLAQWSRLIRHRGLARSV